MSPPPLPYANGHIHIGHLVEYIQTDIWVRFQKLRGQRCIYICADDTHGTAIMIRARQEGRSEEALIADMQAAHMRDFAGFDIEFDNYGSTNSPENRELCGEIWAALRKPGLIAERDVDAALRPGGRHVPGRSVRERHLPELQVARSIWRQLRQVRHRPTARPTDRPGEHALGATPELRAAPHLFVEHRAAARLSGRVDADRAITCRPKWPTI